MRFAHRVPGPPLDAVVQTIWVYEAASVPVSLERVLPTGAAQLIVNLKEDRTRVYDAERGLACVTTAGTVLSGARSRHQIIDSAEQEHVAGVVFKPAGTAAFTRVPAYETADRDVPFEDLWGRCRTSRLRARLLESPGPDAMIDVLEAELREMFAPPGVHPAVAFALAAFDRRPQAASVGRVGDATGMSAKRFIERFKRDVGLTPKRYCRVRRFQRAVTRAHHGLEVDWSHVALDCGYFDQAHFIHDFRAFAGVTPTVYQAGRTSFQNHVKFLQSPPAAV